jgi:hypothetical protein
LEIRNENCIIITQQLKKKIKLMRNERIEKEIKKRKK